MKWSPRERKGGLIEAKEREDDKQDTSGDRDVLLILGHGLLPFTSATIDTRKAMRGHRRLGSDWFRLPLLPLTQADFKIGGGNRRHSRRDGWRGLVGEMKRFAFLRLL
jgi:hypothetical protein